MYEPRFTELFIQNTGVLIHLLYIKHLLITNTFLKILTTLVIKVRVKTDSSYNGASNNGQFFYTRVDFFKWDITGQFLLLLFFSNINYIEILYGFGTIRIWIVRV